MGEWQTIDTVPKDGATYVLGFWPEDDGTGEVYKMSWHEWPDDGPQWIPEYCEVAFGLDYQPTHWMPLPDPPPTAVRAAP